jgi:hypothetical protein
VPSICKAHSILKMLCPHLTKTWHLLLQLSETKRSHRATVSLQRAGHCSSTTATYIRYNSTSLPE